MKHNPSVLKIKNIMKIKFSLKRKCKSYQQVHDIEIFYAAFPKLIYPTYYIKLSTHSSKPHQNSNCLFIKTDELKIILQIWIKIQGPTMDKKNKIKKIQKELSEKFHMSQAKVCSKAKIIKGLCGYSRLREK